eukprot:CAMPEP_0206230682 /NCGR_PEP_ID=MMETSP0047_2-20121206/10402_1 /ASSEMBLY_ACC=CAM_ASM_000192 /TAXON_ID=195065 /ORGANISM="Chroomonas mesostigmatica_cf, Strain CCMP1168" /LENGTH=253 /DNA_ID=CAMNT_0053654147 /DNA_START=41 /DNA_END=802 /DNA_ORIENTATION=+
MSMSKNNQNAHPMNTTLTDQNETTMTSHSLTRANALPDQDPAQLQHKAEVVKLSQMDELQNTDVGKINNALAEAAGAVEGEGKSIGTQLDETSKAALEKADQAREAMSEKVNEMVVEPSGEKMVAAGEALKEASAKVAPPPQPEGNTLGELKEKVLEQVNSAKNLVQNTVKNLTGQDREEEKKPETLGEKIDCAVEGLQTKVEAARESVQGKVDETREATAVKMDESKKALAEQLYKAGDAITERGQEIQSSH